MRYAERMWVLGASSAGVGLALVNPPARPGEWLFVGLLLVLLLVGIVGREWEGVE